eukprot:CAMPEP_0174757732 /NCGR_PEP_ID=MMETSP1094-20130205/107407_1 /TAXON_ID=156173 /ORGANISM="Chrysochromulina brevifilum, Strain UTEX LB 985" /LENGTH=95 /DNA_ID=CAMNT_0015963647 /DNA_START=229 /DNA_END=516 /DNA_ORIENTATION=+
MLDAAAHTATAHHSARLGAARGLAHVSAYAIQLGARLNAWCYSVRTSERAESAMADIHCGRRCLLACNVCATSKWSAKSRTTSTAHPTVDCVSCV